MAIPLTDTFPFPSRAIGIAAHLRAGPIANVIEAVFKLFAGDGRPIDPVFLAQGHLPQGVILINPERTVSESLAAALVGGVIAIGVGARQLVRGTGSGGDRLKS